MLNYDCFETRLAEATTEEKMIQIINEHLREEDPSCDITVLRAFRQGDNHTYQLRVRNDKGREWVELFRPATPLPDEDSDEDEDCWDDEYSD